MKNFANTQILSVGDAGESTQPADDAGGFVLDFVSDPLRVDAIMDLTFLEMLTLLTMFQNS